MKCRDIFAKLSEYLDNEVSDSDSKSIESHFSGCPMCVAFLNTFKKTVEIFKKKPSPKIPKDLSESLRLSIKKESSGANGIIADGGQPPE